MPFRPRGWHWRAGIFSRNMDRCSTSAAASHSDKQERCLGFWFTTRNRPAAMLPAAEQCLQLLRNTKRRNCTQSAFPRKPNLCRAGFLGPALCSLRNPQNQASETTTNTFRDRSSFLWVKSAWYMTHDHCKIMQLHNVVVQSHLPQSRSYCFPLSAQTRTLIIQQILVHHTSGHLCKQNENSKKLLSIRPSLWAAPSIVLISISGWPGDLGRVSAHQRANVGLYLWWASLTGHLLGDHRLKRCETIGNSGNQAKRSRTTVSSDKP